MICIRTTWDYTEHLHRFHSWVERVSACTQLVNPLPWIRWNANKRYLLDLFDQGLPMAPTHWLPAGRDPALARRSRGWERGFLKPAVGATARHTLRFAIDPAGLRAARAHLAGLPEQDMLLRPYLGSVESRGERSAILIDDQVTHWVCKRPPPGDYRVEDDHGASDAPHDPFSLERAVVARCVALLPPLPPIARMDWLLDDRGRPCLNEPELIEPSQFFRHGPAAARRLAIALQSRARTRSLPARGH